MKAGINERENRKMIQKIHEIKSSLKRSRTEETLARQTKKREKTQVTKIN